MRHPHAVVWLDHLHARCTYDGRELLRVDSAREGDERHLHRKARVIGTGKATPDLDFYRDLVALVSEAGEVVLIGPGTAKVEFRQHLEHRHPELAQRVVATEPSDHPTDNELLALARVMIKKYAQFGGIRR